MLRRQQTVRGEHPAGAVIGWLDSSPSHSSAHPGDPQQESHGQRDR